MFLLSVFFFLLLKMYPVIFCSIPKSVLFMLLCILLNIIANEAFALNEFSSLNK